MVANPMRRSSRARQNKCLFFTSIHTDEIMLIRDGKKITMADHFDAPGLKPPNMDARIDICDIGIWCMNSYQIIMRKSKG
jgi:hypothetical protein